jgi:hypothetical protein
MIKAVYKVRFKKIVLAVLLASIAQWSYGGMVICYGADGHIEIEQPGAKDCCKKNEPIVSLDLITSFDFDHCVDIPIAAQKYIASTSYTAPVHNHIIALCIVSPSLASTSRTLEIVNRRDIPPPYNPQLATLKTIILLI